MHRPFPAPDERQPVPLPDGRRHEGTVFLKPVIDHPRIEVGDYSYASAHIPPSDWAAHLAPYLFDFSPERLVIGKFCQIADGALFITASANHRHDGFSTFPFAVFGGGEVAGRPSMPGPGRDTVLGHDVWVGQGARILPGARIGSGVIVGAGAVVGGEVPDYTVVVGNPARVVRRRFPAGVIARLLDIAWWDWPIADVLKAEAAICGGDLRALEAAAETIVA
ncbi:virginiamycin A acetyltransferase [Poseidonocella pacifica]|uniref:Virginiamycin A acetyltransferase n=1 Tax=Poseidonocella pacifica TaxID=871651 RepID=A0A1I0WPR0_9RHOB|nr:CatB-related O-acetyltransferase [Poseidonocella pacifica]SFA89966.1 virginiamycin A acetyltransferase [Poseidonocella pacifica]